MTATISPEQIPIHAESTDVQNTPFSENRPRVAAPAPAGDFVQIGAHAWTAEGSYSEQPMEVATAQSPTSGHLESQPPTTKDEGSSTMYEINADELPHWQNSLTSNRSEALDWPITRLCLPGTHDSATYGPGSFPTNLGRFNWHCQSRNIYEQAQIGVRYFDLRLERANKTAEGSQFWPFHGAAKRTGDLFADGPKGLSLKDDGLSTKNWQKTIAGQLLKFVEENPTEIIVIRLTLKDDSKFPDTIWQTLLSTLAEGGRWIPNPDHVSAGQHHRIPTIAEVRARGQNLVIIADSVPGDDGSTPPLAWEFSDENVKSFVRTFVWDMPGNGVLEGPYTSDTWKSNDPQQVRKAIEDWMHTHETTISQLTHFWAAQCQLTPSMNNFADLIRSIWDRQITTTPAKLSPIMNPYVQKVLLQDSLWRRRVSMVQVDFAEPAVISDIVKVNFDSDRRLQFTQMDI